MLNPNFVIVGSLINFSGVFFYTRDIFRGKAKPNLVSWSMWAIAPLIAFFAELSKGVGIQSLLTFSAGFGPLLIIIAASISKHSKWKLTRFDFVCGGLSLLGLLGWAITRQGNVAIVFSIASDALAVLPTIKKSYAYPDTENDIAYWAGFVGIIITILTINHWVFATYAFPIYLAIANFALAFVITYRSHSRKDTT